MVRIFFERQIKTEENSPDRRTRRPPPFDRRPPQRRPPPEIAAHRPLPAFNTKRIFVSFRNNGKMTKILDRSTIDGRRSRRLSSLTAPTTVGRLTAAPTRTTNQATTGGVAAAASGLQRALRAPYDDGPVPPRPRQRTASTGGTRR